MNRSIVKKLFILVSCAIFTFAGCESPKPAQLKKDLDREMYGMVDSKWRTEFGPRTNYKIQGAESSPDDIKVSRVLPPGAVLSLPQAVAIATDHNRVYQLEKEDLYIKALDLRLARHKFDPVLFGSAAAEYINARDSGAIEERGSIGVQKLFETGAQIGVSITLSWLDIVSGNARGGLSKILTVSAMQPILRGSDPNVVLENLKQAERDTLYQIRSFSRFRKTFVVAIITQYYQVLQAYDAAQNARNNYDKLVSVCDYAEKLAAAGRVPQYELEQAVQDKLIARDTYIRAEKIYKQSLDEFKLSLAVPSETELQLDYNELTVLRGVEMKMPVFSETEAIETALAYRLDLANSFDAINDGERKVLVALDNLRPDLRIVAAADLKSKNTSDPFNLRVRPFDNAAVGVEFDPLLDKYAQQNAYRLALVVLDRNRRLYEEKIDRVILDIRRAYRNLAEATQRYENQSEQLRLAKQRFDNTMNLLQYMRANTRDVLDAQKDLYRAQDEATAALVNYTIAMLRFYRDVEILQVKPDGMWQTSVAQDN
jgi:outer membrane protein TolC